MKQILATSFLLLACSTANVHAETIVLKPGDYKVTTAKTLTFDGQTIELAGIDAPLPGQMCILRGREHDCGVIARSQLMCGWSAKQGRNDRVCRAKPCEGICL